MDRRGFLVSALSLSTLSAGCLDGEALEDEPPDADDGGGEDEDDDSSTGYRLSSTEFEVTSRVPGNAVDSASVEFDAGGRTVSVEGVVSGSTSCKTAELEDVEYDDVEDVLSVRLVTVDMEDADEVCNPTFTEIGYTASAAFAGGLPYDVEVYHDGDLVVASER
ncbi:MAG: hypothetical protein ACOCT0_00700 [Halobacteriota archaeon]